uniref:Rho-GAP domain-containing protein n=1 Tax=Anopheles christyi TaxID=43041 RepID=A0A182KCJ6_9DIPT
RRRNSALEVGGRWKITKQQYQALLACIDYLEQHIGVYGLFVTGGSVMHVRRIFDKIKSGCPSLLKYLRVVHAPRECAMAFHQFLSLYQVQVLPQRCIDVVLGDVVGVPKRLIALDVLNLLHEEYDDTRLHFAKRYLQLMRRFTLYGYLRPTEVQAVITPYLALPKIFPSPDLRSNMQGKSITLLELFLLAQLLDDPSALSEQLHQACAMYWQTNED